MRRHEPRKGEWKSLLMRGGDRAGMRLKLQFRMELWCTVHSAQYLNSLLINTYSGRAKNAISPQCGEKNPAMTTTVARGQY